MALADRVALLADGRITAVGTHSELLATEPSYRLVLSAAADESALSADADDDEELAQWGEGVAAR